MSALKNAKTAAGLKQVSRAVSAGRAAAVFIAEDAAVSLTAPLKELCAREGVSVSFCPSMAELGKACGLSVGTAACALLR